MFVTKVVLYAQFKCNNYCIMGVSLRPRQCILSRHDFIVVLCKRRDHNNQTMSKINLLNIICVVQG